MSQSTTKSVVDSLGFIPVLPGPCSLFRYEHFKGIVHEYFALTTEALKGDGSDIVLGNVQLAEDRFPPVLLTFRKADNLIFAEENEEEKDDDKEKKPLRLVTGFEHDAVFYFEAEKPLGQLVKQRRRWINGSYMAGYWALKGGWIGTAANHGIVTQVGAAAVLLFELLQGAMIRLLIPATLSCGLCFMVTILPAIYNSDTEQVRDAMNGKSVSVAQFTSGMAAAGAYLGIFALFMVAHTPRAVPSEDSNGEIVSYYIETKSAYRPWLFGLSFLANVILTAMFFYVGAGVYILLGWQEAPIYFRALSLLIPFPYVVTLMDGVINSTRPSIRAFLNLLWLTPIFMVSSLWFYVWFPCYATARISDLSWGNRAAHEQSASSNIARHRAYLGRVVSVSVVVSNVLVAIVIIGVMNVVTEFLTVVLFTLLGFNILLHLVNVLDMIVRLFLVRIPNWLFGSPPPALKLRAANWDENEEEGGANVDDDSSEEGSEDFTVHYSVVPDYSDNQSVGAGSVAASEVASTVTMISSC
jgi:hypothetical protein